MESILNRIFAPLSRRRSLRSSVRVWSTLKTRMNLRFCDSSSGHLKNLVQRTAHHCLARPVVSAIRFSSDRHRYAVRADRTLTQLVTDRPEFTEASSTVGQGIAQLEFGYTFTHDDDGISDTRSHSYPEPLLRYGVLADWLELRVGWNYANEATNGLDFHGSEDLYLGFKLGLTPQEVILPEMALIPQMAVPTGASAFTANEVLPGANLIYGWEINDFLSTAGGTQFNSSIVQSTMDPEGHIPNGLNHGQSPIRCQMNEARTQNGMLSSRIQLTQRRPNTISMVASLFSSATTSNGTFELEPDSTMPPMTFSSAPDCRSVFNNWSSICPIHATVEGHSLSLTVRHPYRLRWRPKERRILRM